MAATNIYSRHRKDLLVASLVIIVLTIITVVLVRIKSNPDVAVQKKTYVALGDSVAAGVGLETASDSSACDRSNEAYPNIIAKKYSYELHNIACSGATLQSGILGSQAVNGAIVPSQKDQLFTLRNPSLISITIGANDIGWTDIITRCFTSDCGSATDSANVDEKLLVLSKSLTTLFQSIQSDYNSTVPSVIVTGYYSVFGLNTPTCSDSLNLSKIKLTWWAQQEDKLNNTIQTATQGYSFVHYAGVSFASHELCTDLPWIQGLNNKAPFHPSDEGQKNIATQIAKILDTL